MKLIIFVEKKQKTLNHIENHKKWTIKYNFVILPKSLRNVQKQIFIDIIFQSFFQQKQLIYCEIIKQKPQIVWCVTRI